jgi:hypothetical protein
MAKAKKRSNKKNNIIEVTKDDGTFLKKIIIPKTKTTRKKPRVISKVKPRTDTKTVDKYLHSNKDFTIIDEDGLEFKITRVKLPDDLLPQVINNLNQPQKVSLWQLTKMLLTKPWF